MSLTRRFAALIVLFALLQGCATNISRPSAERSGPPPFAEPALQVRTVELQLADSAKKQLWYNDNLKPARVLAAMKRNLQERNMLGNVLDTRLPTIEIVVTDIRARSPGAAIWLGFLAGEDRIVGDVIVRDPAGVETDRFSVKATYAWGGPFGTEHARMNYLYDAFAEHAARGLTGRSLPHEVRERIASQI